MSESTKSKAAAKILEGEEKVQEVLDRVSQQQLLPIRSKSERNRYDAWSNSDLSTSAPAAFTGSTAATVIPATIVSISQLPSHLQALTLITQQLIASGAGAAPSPSTSSSRAALAQHQEYYPTMVESQHVSFQQHPLSTIHSSGYIDNSHSIRSANAPAL
ncbi:unnamed protein product [Didymodactylos carnosus]|uniref:Uncharacterized protein n=1 Tax=Didymodactylos carnosus TaxID=1234261 RepID=A0A814JZM9_9BILA|nr:unnamed protein product [Didymodactylos carnosus]CAF1305200.1 unnamed protein product [Didymodactylos carnosus]CAF3814685.1 unnamed protein product [Didymodactylos carnosus]CAF4112193.1 unnamed protein product [Didymodactylos carnosus]